MLQDLPDAFAIAQAVRARRLRAVDVMRAYLDRTAQRESELNTYAALDADGAMAAAREVDRALDAGRDPGVLAGVPVSVKDLIAVQGLPLTFGSHLFSSTAAEDAPSVARLRAAGACITGKTTTSELGSKAVGDSLRFGATRNPWDVSRTAGGSSAGAAAGVAAGLVPVALGTDGGGSIRIPGAFCGLVGVKASFGRVPVWPPSATVGLAHVGPLARSVRDCALLLSVIAGPDARDADSLKFGPWVDDMQAPRGVRIGWCEDFAYGWADGEAKAAAHEGAQLLAGALGSPLQAWRGLPEDPAPAWSLQFYGGIARRLGVDAQAKPEIESQIDPLLAQRIARFRAGGIADPQQAQRLREANALAIDEAFSQFDLLLTPTTPVPALPVGRDAPEGREELGAVEWSYFTYPFNLTGHPAATFPAGRTREGLPLGLQLVARIGDEALLLAALRQLEQQLPPAIIG